MAQISNCYLEYHSEFITLWRPQAVCSNCVMLQVNMDLKMESMLPRIKAVLEVKVQNSTRKEYLSECMLSCSCRITLFFLSIREQICNVLAEFFFCEKNIKASKNLFLCLPIVYRCPAVSRKWDNFQRKKYPEIFLCRFLATRRDLKKKT